MLRFFTHSRLCPMTAEVLSDAGAVRATDPLDDWDLYIPRYGGRFSEDLAGLLPSRTDQWIAGIPGSWRLTNKSLLWGGLCHVYGRRRASVLTPESWVLDADRELLVAQHRPGQHYILKNPLLQRRTGLRLTDDLDAVLAGPAAGFTLAQRLLPDLLLLGGHRFNLRLYLLLIRQDGVLSLWRHEQGRCVCAPDPLSGELLAEEAVITRSVGSDVLGAGLPLTLQDALAMLPDPALTLRRLDAVLHRIAEAVLPGLCLSWSLSDNPAYQLLGVDAVISREGTVRVVELNAGPDLRPHCAVDHALKFRVVRDVFEHLGMLPVTGASGFRLLLDQATVGDSTLG
jgi:hypothetical protein